MSPQSSQDVFTRICRAVEERYADMQPLCGAADVYTAEFCGGADLALDELRSRASDVASGHPDRIAAWQHIAHHAGEEPDAGGVQSWTLIAVFLLASRLRGAAYSIARRTGAERADVCSAVLQGTLQGVRTLGQAAPSAAEQHLMDAAFAAGWRTGRRGPRETLVGEWGATQEQAAPATTITADAVVCVERMSTALSQQAQGERLGSLAYRLDLLADARQARRHRLRRPSGGVHHELCSQPGLFEIGELVDEASP